MKKQVIAILVIFVMLVFFTACSNTPVSTTDETADVETTEQSTDTTESESSETEEKQIIVAGINLQEDQFSSWCALGYQAACDDYGVKMLHAISGGDPAKEVELLNTYATQNVDGIAIMPASVTTSVEAIKQVYDNYGIPDFAT